MRLYNGCPDDELAAIWKSRDSMKSEAKRLGYHLTWYPAEEKWGAGTDIYLSTPYRMVGPLCDSLEEAMSFILKDAEEVKEKNYEQTT